MRRPRRFRRAALPGHPEPRLPSAERAEVARDIAKALPALIAKAKAADLSAITYLLSVAQDLAAQAARTLPGNDADGDDAGDDHGQA